MRFGGVRAELIVSSRSDHLLMLLHVNHEQASQYPQRFKLKNLWLQEASFQEVVIASWNSSNGLELVDRGMEMVQNLYKNFQKENPILGKTYGAIEEEIKYAWVLFVQRNTISALESHPALELILETKSQRTMAKRRGSKYNVSS